MIKKAFKHGDSYLMVWEDLQAPDDAPSDEHVQQVGVQWTVHDARLVRVFYDPEDERVKTYAIKRWKITLEGEDNPRTRADFWYPDRLERWITQLGAGSPATRPAGSRTTATAKTGAAEPVRGDPLLPCPHGVAVRLPGA